MERALQEIDLVTGEIEAGKTYRGIVRGVKGIRCFRRMPTRQGGTLSHFPNWPISGSTRPRTSASWATKSSSNALGSMTREESSFSRRAALEEAKSSEADDSTPEDDSEQPAKEEAEPAVS